MNVKAGDILWITTSIGIYDRVLVLDVNPSETAAKVRYVSKDGGCYHQPFVWPTANLISAEEAQTLSSGTFKGDPDDWFGYMTAISRIPTVPDLNEDKFEYTPGIWLDRRWSDKCGYAFVTFSEKLLQCPSCGKLMGNPINEQKQAQYERAGFVKAGRFSPKHDAKICTECEKQGKATFECWLCEEERPMSDIRESFGDSPDYLCETCYKTVSAAEWNRAVDELMDEHRFDYE